MHSQLPCVSVGLDLLGFTCHGVVRRLLGGPIPKASLEVGVVIDPVWRVDVDHLDLARQSLFLKQARHDDQGVAENQTVCPVHGVPVELDRFSSIKFFISEEVELAGFLLDRSHDRCGREPFMNVNGWRLDLK